jgi:hypothetical protein
MKKKYESPTEYRIRYKHSGYATEQYHYYSCYSGEEALDTFEKIASQKGWDDLRIIHVEEYNRWKDAWEVLSHEQSQI